VCVNSTIAVRFRVSDLRHFKTQQIGECKRNKLPPGSSWGNDMNLGRGFPSHVCASRGFMRHEGTLVTPPTGRLLLLVLQDGRELDLGKGKHQY
jgi:hypothetical protein